MAWRGVLLTQKAHLSLSDDCCLVERDDGNIRLAFEDIAYLIIDTPQITLSTAVLARILEANILIVICDGKHLPTGACLPLQGHFRQSQTFRLQLRLKPALAKVFWQRLIMAKIQNQAAVLRSLEHARGQALATMADRVRPGDPGQVEARAAQVYFPAAFNQMISRRDDNDIRNAMLNYGYAVVRAAIARALAARGFHPALGIHHDSMDNAFNLADDLIEPWRAIVDRHVLDLMDSREEQEQLTVDDRRELARILVSEVNFTGKSYTVIAAIDEMADGLFRAIESGDPDQLGLPALRP